MPIAFVRSEFNMLAPHSWPRNPKLASFSLNSPIEALAWLRQLKLLTSVENYIVILSCWTHSASHPHKKNNQSSNDHTCITILFQINRYASQKTRGEKNSNHMIVEGPQMDPDWGVNSFPLNDMMAA